MIPGPAALCEGTIVHRRVAPEAHEFTYRVSQVWIDPDHPAELCDLHPAWSHRRPALVRFRRSDYGAESMGSLADAARDDLAEVVGHRPLGPVRMVSQVRRWGWLFNPITLFLVWDQPEGAAPTVQRPVGAVLEVTNTPWKERTRYPLGLKAEDEHLVAEFDKALHVSPFLGMEHRYRLRIKDQDEALSVDIDVADSEGGVILYTKLRLRRQEATRPLLTGSIRSHPLPTHRVSAGIHSQAMRLWAKRVPFIAHPRKASPDTPKSPSASENP